MFVDRMSGAPIVETAVGDPALRAARGSAVVCGLEPLSLLAVTGPDAAAFLNGQLSIDTATLAPDRCRYACFNSPKGRMLANFVVWREPLAHERFLILLPGELATSVSKRLSMYVLRSKVTIADVSDEITRIGVGGPDAGRAVDAAIGAAPAPFELRTIGARTVLGL